MYKILGDPQNAQLNKPLDYFENRFTFLDCRGKIVMEETAMLGFNVKIFTMSHNPNDWSIGTYREVVLGRNVFIGSNSVLYNTIIGDNSIVAIGTVMRSRDVPPNCIVEGNPARIVKRKVLGKWVACDEPLRLKSTEDYDSQMPEDELP
jgi:acetyltransferase-like isoleucine patch superfamily enzyme